MKTPDQIVLPSGSSLGVLGGGQLGRMFVVAARTMGYRAVVLDPDPQSPAGQVADEHICLPYEDTAGLYKLAETCAAVTVEFESVPTGALEYLEQRVVVSPSPGAFAISQNRIAEKRFVKEIGVATVAFEPVCAGDDIEAAFRRLSAVALPPYILKTARLGYDGKCQAEVSTLAEAAERIAAFGAQENIFEEKVDLEHEVSIIVVRDSNGETRCYPVARNEHRGGILHSSVVPAGISPSLSDRVREVAMAVAEAMDYRGVLGVEFFITTDGRLLVNELAPRPHNSGHYTLDACAVSQFQQQVRVMCGLPAGDTRLQSAAVMVNLLGDLWQAGEPPWQLLLSRPDLKLHLYGKQQARPGRKMGHFCMVGNDAEQLLGQANALFGSLTPGPATAAPVFSAPATSPVEVPPFEAWRIHQSKGTFRAGFETLCLDDLTDGEVVVEVACSGVNYKDAMASTNRARILRHSSLNGGIDLAGRVVSDASGRFAEGGQVFAQGAGLGELYDGGYAQYARLPADVVMALPDTLSAFDAMAIGTAGFTAAYAIELMERNGQRPDDGPVLVTGATGGVGSFAVSMLSRLGYRCVAATRKQDRADYLKGLGAERVIDAVEPVTGTVGKGAWAGAIDNLGGDTLAAIVKTTRPRGNVVCVGRAQSEDLPLSVIPFIIRGVNLLGVTSANCPMAVRRRIWSRIVTDARLGDLDGVAIRAVSLAQLPGCFEQLMAGGMCGRFVVRVGD